MQIELNTVQRGSAHQRVGPNFWQTTNFFSSVSHKDIITYSAGPMIHYFTLPVPVLETYQGPYN